MIGRVYKRTGEKSRRGGWWIDYTDPGTGRRVKRKIGPSKAEAEAVLAKVRTDTVEKGVFQIKKLPQVRFEDFVVEYLEWAKANKKSWDKDAIYFRSMGRVFKGKLLSEITQYDVEKYKAMRSQETRQNTWRNPRPVTHSHVNHELQALKAFFNKAIAWEKVERNPVKGVRFFKVDSGRTRYLDQKEIQALLTECEGRPSHLKAVVTIAIHTMMRRGEILNLRWDDIDYKINLLYIREAKSGESRSVPMNQHVLDALRSCVSVRHLVDTGSPYVFCDRNGRPYRDLKKGFNAAVKRAGITNFTFHGLRHTGASLLASNGVDVMVLKELLGHKTLAMTLRYAHLFPDRKRRAVELLDRICVQNGPHVVPSGVRGEAA